MSTKQKFVKDIAVGDEFTDPFQAVRPEYKTTKTGSGYLSLILGDKSGQIEAKYWNVPENLAGITSGQFVKIKGLCESYREQPQVKILQMRLLDRSEYEIADFLPVSSRDPMEMLEELRLVIDTNVRSPQMSAFLYALIDDHRAELLIAPAAKAKHQAWLGGLLEHVLTICEVAVAIAPIYQLDLDILLAGAIVHDVGKLQELSHDTAIDMTPIGKLAGHVLLGSQILANYEHRLTRDAYVHLLHVLSSHHGRREWGAICLPATKEAIVLHLLDLLDSRLSMFDQALKSGTDPAGFTSYQSLFETALWNGASQNSASNEVEKQEAEGFTRGMAGQGLFG